MQLKEALSKGTQGVFKLTGKAEHTKCIESNNKHIAFNIATMDAALMVHGDKLLKAGIVDLLERLYLSTFWGTSSTRPSRKEISDMLVLAENVEVPEENT